jgi:hypothetical protein
MLRFVTSGSVHCDRAIKPRQLRITVLEKLQVVPKVSRELRELRARLRQLNLLASQTRLDVNRARVELV